MKNKWRPKEWDGVNPKPIGTPMACAFNREDMYKHGEMCADAMLEALYAKGYLVFIPEGDDDDKSRC